ncbi:zinc finger protein 267-like [Solea solea]|uniref:zinc finger protein 267-like n=1 Tax=Solea solea TaxID=90069 RepID=UPI00272C0CD3|nr:zinc finger protein 267-like [Solea solea]
MSSLQCLRDLINGRLTAAAEEIFTHVERIVVEYEEEVDRQRKLLQIVCKPRLQLQRIEFAQQNIYHEEEEVLTDQERNSSLDQEDPESLQIKKEKICTSQEEQLELKQEADTFMLTPDNKESDHMEPEPDTDHQLLSAEAESQDQTNITGEKAHMCNICKKSFVRKYNFMYHMRIHTGEKPFSCETCGKRFRGNSHLMDHKRIHTGERPYSCDTCGQCFSESSALSKHKIIHTGEKPHVCNICKRCFGLKCTLIRHMRIHTGEMPYPCETCGQLFRHRQSLLIHKRKLHR